MYSDETPDETEPTPEPAFIQDNQWRGGPTSAPASDTPPVLIASLPADGIVHTVTLAADASIAPLPTSDPATVAAQLADSIAAHIQRAGVVARVAVLAAGPPDVTFTIRAADTSAARAAATAVIRADEGRNWRYLGDGPDLDTGDRVAILAVAV